MAKRIRITAGQVSLTAVLNDTATAQAIWDALPITARANTWGDEIYFSVPVMLETEEGQETVEVGDLGYWSPGTALCVFFGPTPMSRGDEIRPASPVTVFGHLEGDATLFRAVSSGTRVTVERTE